MVRTHLARRIHIAPKNVHQGVAGLLPGVSSKDDPADPWQVDLTA